MISVMIDPELLDRVDEARGDVSRAIWLAHAAEMRLDAPLRTSKAGDPLRRAVQAQQRRSGKDDVPTAFGSKIPNR